jgi:hypothetical protein
VRLFMLEAWIQKMKRDGDLEARVAGKARGWWDDLRHRIWLFY